MTGSADNNRVLPAMWRLETRVGEKFREDAENLFEDGSVSLSSFKSEFTEEWRIEAFYTSPPGESRIRQCLNDIAGEDVPLTIEAIPEKDWLQENRNNFPALEIGRFYIHSSHLPPSRRHNFSLRLNAATAFGSGEHATTSGCLTALQDLAKCKKISNALDMGCGSGILALTMASLWRAPVVASDIDPEAMRVTARNARNNHLHTLIRATSGTGYASPAVQNNAPYDLIVSNILANPLCKLAPSLSSALRPKQRGGGNIVLSGLLVKDGAKVIAAHRRFGFKPVKRYIEDGWLTLCMER